MRHELISATQLHQHTLYLGAVWIPRQLHAVLLRTNTPGDTHFVPHATHFVPHATHFIPHATHFIPHTSFTDTPHFLFGESPHVLQVCVSDFLLFLKGLADRQDLDNLSTRLPLQESISPYLLFAFIHLLRLRHRLFLVVNRLEVFPNILHIAVSLFQTLISLEASLSDECRLRFRTVIGLSPVYFLSQLHIFLLYLTHPLLLFSFLQLLHFHCSARGMKELIIREWLIPLSAFLQDCYLVLLISLLLLLVLRFQFQVQSSCVVVLLVKSFHCPFPLQALLFLQLACLSLWNQLAQLLHPPSLLGLFHGKLTGLSSLMPLLLAFFQFVDMLHQFSLFRNLRLDKCSRCLLFFRTHFF